MSTTAIKWAFAQCVRSSTGKLMLLVLADHADDEGRCRPKQRTLAQRVECSATTVRLHLARLEKDGPIERIPQWRRDGGQDHNAYQLAIIGCRERGEIDDRTRWLQ